MPRFFFHRTGDCIDSDPDGTELNDELEARTQAVVYAGELLKENPRWAEEHDLRIEVADETGRLLFTVVTTSIKAEPQAA